MSALRVEPLQKGSKLASGLATKDYLGRWASAANDAAKHQLRVRRTPRGRDLSRCR